MRRMFRERNPVPLGLIVAVWLISTVLLVLNIEPVVGSFGRQHAAVLPEAAGLKQGDPVRVSGLRVGRVRSVELGDDGVLVRFTVTDNDISLGDQTEAHVGVETVLGDRVLELTSAGRGELAEDAVIPLERTSAPYDVTDALSDLTVETGELDLERVTEALDTVSEAVGGTGPELREAVRGLGRISRTISSRDEALRSLLDHADDFSEVLADRSDDLVALVGDANLLFAELLERRESVRSLLSNLTAMSEQLGGVVEDNEASIGPALKELNSVIATLRKNKKNLGEILRGLSVYATGLGEAVGTGEYFTAYLQNLLPGNLLVPRIDLGELGLRDLFGGGGR